MSWAEIPTARGLLELRAPSLARQSDLVDDARDSSRELLATPAAPKCGCIEAWRIACRALYVRAPSARELTREARYDDILLHHVHALPDAAHTFASSTRPQIVHERSREHV